jgi:hypothetical protein
MSASNPVRRGGGIIDRETLGRNNSTNLSSMSPRMSARTCPPAFTARFCLSSARPPAHLSQVVLGCCNSTPQTSPGSRPATRPTLSSRRHSSRAWPVITASGNTSSAFSTACTASHDRLPVPPRFHRGRVGTPGASGWCPGPSLFGDRGSHSSQLASTPLVKLQFAIARSPHDLHQHAAVEPMHFAPLAGRHYCVTSAEIKMRVHPLVA